MLTRPKLMLPFHKARRPERRGALTFFLAAADLDRAIQSPISREIGFAFCVVQSFSPRALTLLRPPGEWSL